MAHLPAARPANAERPTVLPGAFKCLRGSLRRQADRERGEELLRDAGLDADEAKSSLRWMLKALEARGEPRETLHRWLARRAAREPLQYILGSWPFHPLPVELKLRPPVLIPRPETEELVDHILHRAPRPGRLLELGSGSGAIVVSLLHGFPDATAVALDPSAAAIALTAENAERCGVAARLELLRCRAGALGAEQRGFDLVVSNPPYIPSGEMPGLQREVRDFEDHLALDGGPDGLQVVREVLDTAQRVARPGASIYLEVHHTHPAYFEADQAAWAARGLNVLRTWRDVYGQPRFVELQKSLEEPKTPLLDPFSAVFGSESAAPTPLNPPQAPLFLLRVHLCFRTHGSCPCPARRAVPAGPGVPRQQLRGCAAALRATGRASGGRGGCRRHAAGGHGG